VVLAVKGWYRLEPAVLERFGAATRGSEELKDSWLLAEREVPDMRSSRMPGGEAWKREVPVGVERAARLPLLEWR
jgi:hypothetical protein